MTSKRILQESSELAIAERDMRLATFKCVYHKSQICQRHVDVLGFISPSSSGSSLLESFTSRKIDKEKLSTE